MSELKAKLNQLICSILESKHSADRQIALFDELHTQLSVAVVQKVEGFQHQPRSLISDSGIGILTPDAGRCLLSFRRTIKYWRALESALAQYEKDKVVHIFYPGCGPFASLVLPLLMGVFDQKIKITMIDFHETTARSLKSLLQLTDNETLVDSVVVANALEWEPKEPIDILILECMMNGLREEGQVALTHHLARYLSDKGCLIPKGVRITAYLTDLAKEMAFIQSDEARSNSALIRDKLMDFRVRIGDVFTLDKNSYKKLNSMNNTVELATLKIPSPPSIEYVFTLATEIVFDNQNWIQEYEDGLTQPFVPDFATRQLFNTTKKIKYQQGNQPGFQLA